MGLFHQKLPSRSLIHDQKYFRISLRIRRDINKYGCPTLCGGMVRDYCPALDKLVKPELFDIKEQSIGPALCSLALDQTL
jgi:hypothetical protein